jgi:hypothetical protein
VNALQANYAQVRQRLWNPPNGRHSSEIEIISTAEALRRERAALRAQALAEALQRRQRRKELFEAFIEAHKRTGFHFGMPNRDGDPDRPVSFDQIARTVCRHYGQKKLLVFSSQRSAKLVRPRQVIMYLCAEYTSMSYPMIARHCGKRDHTTALHGSRKIFGLLTSGNEKLKADIEAIKESLGL